MNKEDKIKLLNASVEEIFNLSIEESWHPQHLDKWLKIKEVQSLEKIAHELEAISAGNKDE